MFWLVAYLCVGAVYILVQEMQSLRNVALGRDTDPAAELTGGALLLYRLVALPLGVIVFVLGWPAAPAIMLWERGRERRRLAREKKMQFIVRRRDLIARCSTEEIEAIERVADPMGAVPVAPFGHLNGAWRQFRDDLNVEVELWSFSRTWNDRGTREQRSGYASLKRGKVIAHFPAQRKKLGESIRWADMRSDRSGP